MMPPVSFECPPQMPTKPACAPAAQNGSATAATTTSFQRMGHPPPRPHSYHSRLPPSSAFRAGLSVDRRPRRAQAPAARLIAIHSRPLPTLQTLLDPALTNLS